jgi:serine/threonine protein kinase
LVSCRDLKLDNTILDHRDPPRLKLCDFGFAKAWAANSNMDTMRIGTPEYMGPELISGRCATWAVLGPSGIFFFWGGVVLQVDTFTAERYSQILVAPADSVAKAEEGK